CQPALAPEPQRGRGAGKIIIFAQSNKRPGAFLSSRDRSFLLLLTADFSYKKSAKFIARECKEG
ncbi:hypothetical protein, partial [Desulfovibrio piger]|uniref:hypothetical protein n=1 Tax=Desulfovibrio piger TaxID=901 RepID=UPI0026F258E3